MEEKDVLDTREADLRKRVFAKAHRPGEPECGEAASALRQTTLTLSNAHLRLGVKAGTRGGIVQMDWNDRGMWTPVFRRPARQSHLPVSRELSCEPVIRIPDVAQVVQIRAMSSGVWAAGAGRLLPVSRAALVDDWEVDSATEASLRLRTGVAECCRAVQTYELDGPTLEITVELENSGCTPLRCGIDIEAALMRDLHARISAPAGGIWIAGGAGSAPRLVPTPFAWQFGVTHCLPATKIDHAFTRWGGKALVEWPARQFSLAIVGNTDCYRLRGHPEDDSFSFQVVNEQSEHRYIGQGEDVHGLTVLAAGKTLSRRVSFTVERLASLTRTTRQPSE